MKRIMLGLEGFWLYDTLENRNVSRMTQIGFFIIQTEEIAPGNDRK
jgi:hypothetical protein